MRHIFLRKMAAAKAVDRISVDKEACISCHQLLLAYEKLGGRLLGIIAIVAGRCTDCDTAIFSYGKGRTASSVYQSSNQETQP